MLRNVTRANTPTVYDNARGGNDLCLTDDAWRRFAFIPRRNS